MFLFIRTDFMECQACVAAVIRVSISKVSSRSGVMLVPRYLKCGQGDKMAIAYIVGSSEVVCWQFFFATGERRKKHGFGLRFYILLWCSGFSRWPGSQMYLTSFKQEWISLFDGWWSTANAWTIEKTLPVLTTTGTRDLDAKNKALCRDSNLLCFRLG